MIHSDFSEGKPYKQIKGSYLDLIPITASTIGVFAGGLILLTIAMCVHPSVWITCLFVIALIFGIWWFIHYIKKLIKGLEEFDNDLNW